MKRERQGRVADVREQVDSNGIEGGAALASHLRLKMWLPHLTLKKKERFRGIRRWRKGTA